MKIDYKEYRILTDKETIYLTRTQNNILQLLYNNKNNIVTYEDIAKEIYNSKYDDLLKNLIKKHISILRKKISKYIEIKTVRDIGYIIEEDLK